MFYWLAIELAPHPQTKAASGFAQILRKSKI
jgi:hypothetical protein